MDTHVATNQCVPKKAPPVPLNGVNTPKLFATIDVVGDQPPLAQFQFRAQGHWMGGTHSRPRCPTSPAPAASTARGAFKADADHPAVLCGEDKAPTPGRIRAACARRLPDRRHREHRRRARRHSAVGGTSSLEGDIDLRGILGLSNEVRNGFRSIRVGFTDQRRRTGRESCRTSSQQACARSAVLDILSNGVPITVETNT